MTETASDDGKTIGIIAYLTLIGWIIALVMHNDKKTDFGAFHIRQALGLLVTSLACAIVVWVITFALIMVGFYYGGFISWIIYLAVFVLWVIGFIGAIQGEKKPVPLLGDKFQAWFKGIG
ncbi:MAG TPA: hypothetical protein PKW08_04125 [Flavobacteriaceae bacterium]|nr:hypothetical protein [Flavobacteriaceae bacterium]MCB9213414.1 hypothetical protein [Alteromonas sp.]HPF10308.1 hypothetical protein [Flavobacteriaceae bacterium]HQU20754.1 hypothetical protein [Flavobacteriaceae bacterium]HQU64828.1 hypothetical protein [Flavobacteriaceae bacterium]